MNPKVSIIVPNYNHGKFLSERLESIFNQTFQNFEVILLDDFSQDHSVKILEKYAEKPQVSHFVVNKKNSGNTFKQWRKGIALSKGELIWIAESDDFCNTEFLKEVISMFSSDTIISYTDSILVDEKGLQTKGRNWEKNYIDKEKWLKNYNQSGFLEIKEALCFRNTIPNASAVVFRNSESLRESISKINLIYCGDWAFWIALLKKGNIAYTANQLNFFRKHEGTTRSFKGLRLERDRMREYSSIIFSNTTWTKRIVNLSKYDWIILNWMGIRKHLTIYQFLIAPLPLEMLIRLWYKYFVKVCFSNFKKSERPI